MWSSPDLHKRNFCTSNMLLLFQWLLCTCLITFLTAYNFSVSIAWLTSDHESAALHYLFIINNQESKVQDLETTVAFEPYFLEELNITATFLSCNRLQNLLSALSSFFKYYPEVKTKPVVLVDCYNSTLVNKVTQIYGDGLILINATDPPL